MRRTTKYVALDVHQTTTVASVREESGRVIARTIMPTEEPAIVEFFGGMRGAIHVTFEEGTQAQWMHDLLEPLVDRVVVCDGRGNSRQGNKGDQVDADELSELLRRGAMRAVYHGSADRATLKELARTYQNVVEDATRVMLRLKALFRARGIKAPGKSVYHPRNRAEWLAKLPDRSVRYRAEALGAQLDVLRELRPKVKAAVVAEARRDPAWPVLGNIPFLGPVRVALLLATMRTPWRFRTKRNLWAYCGLAVVSFSSSDYTLVDGRPVRRRRAPRVEEYDDDLDDGDIDLRIVNASFMNNGADGLRAGESGTIILVNPFFDMNGERPCTRGRRPRPAPPSRRPGGALP